MISMYKWQQVRVMKEKGVGIKRIAKVLRISKNTVRKYLRSSDPPKFKARAYEKKIDPYQEEVQQMLQQGYIGTRIFNEIKQRGYVGSLSGVHRTLRRYQQAQQIKKASTTRVETAAGEQMQYDWKEWRLPVGGRLLKIYLHEVVLSYSRMKHYSVSVSITGEDVMRAIEAAIFFFGGVARELVIDNPKQMVVTHRRDRIVCYNEAFLKFCGLYGVEPNACCNYRARTKGKAERPFYYLQEHLLRGLSAADLCEFDRKLAAFTEEYNRRPHSDLKEAPLARFASEKAKLKPYRRVEPTVLYDREIRQVSQDGYLHYRGGSYPVPMRLCGQQLWVECVFGRTLRVYESSGASVMEQEVRLFEEGLRPPHPEHEAINRGFVEKRASARSAVVNRFLSLFAEAGEPYLTGLRKAVGANLYWHLSEILTLSDLYPPLEIQKALQTAIQMGSYHKNTVLRLLDPGKLRRPAENALLSGQRGGSEPIARPLSAYAGVGEVCHE